MNNLKKVPLKKIFNIYTGRDVIISKTKEGSIPLISHQHDNNGVSKRVTLLKNRILFDHNKTIALADRGVFWCTLQNEDFHIGTRVKALEFKDGPKNKYIRMYFVAAINKLQVLFTEYLENATDKLPDFEIEVPFNEKNEIDYEYIENSFKELEKSSLAKVQDFLSEKGFEKLSDLEVSQHEEDIINSHNTKEFMEYTIDDLFIIKSSKKKFNAKEIKLVKQNEGFPYIVRTSENNGLKGFLNEDDSFLNQGNTISFGQDTATIFYQKDAYFTGDKVKILIPKIENFNEYIAMYIITCMNKAFANFSWGTSSFNANVLKQITLKLPTVNNKLDVEFIERYVRILYKQKLKIIFEIFLAKNEDLEK